MSSRFRGAALSLLLLVVVVVAISSLVRAQDGSDGTVVASSSQAAVEDPYHPDDPHPDQDNYPHMGHVIFGHYIDHDDDSHPWHFFEHSMPWVRGTRKRCEPKGVLKNETAFLRIVKTRYLPEKVCCWERQIGRDKHPERGLVPLECCEGEAAWKKWHCERAIEGLTAYIKEQDVLRGITPDL
jgi:hypothetical protein